VIDLTDSDDLLAWDGPVAPAMADETWFDRFYFDLHGPEGRPALVIGGAIYPHANLQDAYVVAVIGQEQRNLRLSGELSGAPERGVLGPLTWEVVEPLSTWRLRLAGAHHPIGLEFDLEWTARAPAWAVHPIRVEQQPGMDGVTDFNHFFQSGTYAGTLTIDGKPMSVKGWTGQRDRSRGRRRARDRLGMHLWIACQMPGYSIGCNFNLDRDNRLHHFDGAALYEDGTARPIRNLRHRMEVDSVQQLQRGRVELDFEDGETVELSFECVAPGLLMAGGGYGGWHGVKRGPLYMEHERWPLDGSRNPQTLALGLAQTPARFETVGVVGHGLIELALSRSASYSYQADLP
jgi:hypothetical protein